MERGKKPLPLSVKEQRGTLRRHRERGKIEITKPDSLPMKPSWLSVAGEEIWSENIARVAATGVGELDSVIFTLWCNLVGAISQATLTGAIAPGWAHVEVRRLAELLGLGGPKSRVIRTTDGIRRAPNPFSKFRRD